MGPTRRKVLAWIRNGFRDPPTSFATMALIMSVLGGVSGAIGIVRIVLARW